MAQMHFNVWQWSAMPPRIDCPIVHALQRVFGIGHRLPADLTSDDVYAPDPIYDLAATDTSFEESRQIREPAMKAHAEVSIRDRMEGAVRARPRTQTVLRADGVIMVWKTNPPSKRGRWVGPGVCIGTHRGSVWVNVRGSLWKCSQLQCKLATTEESRGLEVQNQLLDDMTAEFQEFPGRRVYTDVEREGVPPEDVDRPSAAPLAVDKWTKRDPRRSDCGSKGAATSDNVRAMRRVLQQHHGQEARRGESERRTKGRDEELRTHGSIQGTSKQAAKAHWNQVSRRQGTRRQVSQ